MASVHYLSLRDGRRCQECGSKKSLTRDHIWPRSKGGCGCSGNSQILCEKCNKKKSNVHDGFGGHQKKDCPENKLRRFMENWQTVRHSDQIKDIEHVLPEIQAICRELNEFRCNNISIHQAHSMTGSVKAWIRDFDKLQEQIQERKEKLLDDRLLENLKKKEAGLAAKLAGVRAEIAKYTDDPHETLMSTLAQHVQKKARIARRDDDYQRISELVERHHLEIEYHRVHVAVSCKEAAALYILPLLPDKMQ